MAWNDSVSTRRIAPLTLSLSDSFTLVDRLFLGVGLRTSDNANNLADNTRILAVQRLLLNDNTLNNWADEAVPRIRVFAVLAANLNNWTDALVRIQSYERALADSEAANWADSHQLLLSRRLALVENTNNWLDSETHQSTLLLSVEDINLPDFGLTPIIDDFNRADEGPPPSANWTLGFAAGLEGTTEPGHKVTSNELANVGNDINQNWWNASTFGPDCEVYLTVTNQTGVIAFGLAARLTDISGFSSNGYYMQVNLSGGGSDRTYQIIRIDNGSVIFLANTTENGVGDLVGNKYGLRVIGDRIQLWGDTGDGWKIRLEAVDSTYSDPGYFGVLSESDNFARWDDFSGDSLLLNFKDDFELLLETAGLLNRSFSDNLFNASEELILGYGLVLDDDANTLTDNVVVTKDYQLLFSETLENWNHSFEQILGYELTFSDNLDQFSDQVIFSRELAFSDDAFSLDDAINIGYGLVVSDDQFNLTDSSELRLDYLLDNSDDLNNLTDNVELSLGYLLEFTDDSLFLFENIELGYGFVFDDSIFFLDEFLELGYGLLFEDDLDNWDDAVLVQLDDNFLALTLSFSDSGALTDSLIIGPGLIFSETIEFLDDEVIIGLGIVIFDDIFFLNDDFDHTLELQETFSDNYDLFDSLEIGYGLIIDETIEFLAEVILIGYGLLFADANTLADSAEVNSEHLLDFSDNLSFSDSIQLNLGVDISINDVFGLSDSFELIVGQHVVFSDNLNNLADSFARDVAGVIDASDVIVITDGTHLGYGLSVFNDLNEWQDSVTTNAPQPPDLSLAFSESLDFYQDELTSQLHFFTSFVDVLTQADAIELGFGLIFEDLAGDLLDAVSLNSNSYLDFNDNLFFTDNVSLQLVYEFSAADTEVFSDSFAISLQQQLIITDLLSNFTDEVELNQTVSLSQADTIVLADAIELQSFWFVIAVEQLILSDDVTVSRETPGGLELADNLDNWQDKFKRSHRSFFVGRIIDVAERNRFTDVADRNRIVDVAEGNRELAISNTERIIGVSGNERTQSISTDDREV